jgi:hypothetical protein
MKWNSIGTHLLSEFLWNTNAINMGLPLYEFYTLKKPLIEKILTDILRTLQKQEQLLAISSKMTKAANKNI